MKKVLVALVVVFMGLPSISHGFTKVGMSIAQFLKIGVGARAIGMGGTFAAVADDATSLYWNPAGIANIEENEIVGTHTKWFADLTHDFVGFVLPLGVHGSIGISSTFLNTSEIEITTTENEDGTGEYCGANDIAMGVTYSRYLSDRFALGITGKYIQQNLYNERASAIAIDIGTTLRTDFYGTKIGMCISNFGGQLKLTGRDLMISSDVHPEIGSNPESQSSLETEPWPLPLNFRVGIALDVIGKADAPIQSEIDRLTLAVDVNHPNDNEERVNLGIEYEWSEKFSARIGYKLNYEEQGLTYGGGFKAELGKSVIVVDYAVADFGRLQSVHRFTLGTRF